MKTFRSSTFILRSSLIAVTLAAAATVAQAGSVSYQATVPSQTTDFTGVVAALPLFNTSLGTLDSVTITEYGYENSSFTLTNTAAAAEKTIFTETLGFTLDNSNASIDALLAINPVLTNVNAVHINANPGQVYSYGPFTYNTLTADPTDSTQTITSDLSLFEGSGDTDFLFGTSTEQIINGGGGNFVYSGVTTAGGYVEITYDYSNTPNVPEPDSLLLFGTGLLGLAGALRYKFVKSR